MDNKDNLIQQPETTCADSGPCRERLLDAASSELAQLKSALQEGGLQSGPDNAGCMVAVTRLIPGCTMEDWSRAAEKLGLSKWLAYPFDNTEGANLLQVQQALDNLSWQSEHDPLTGLANRRSFERSLKLELQRSVRGNSQLSVVMLDIDDFKAVNDTYGHPCGDEVLVRLAHHLNSGKRAYDVAARIGGEEFALVLPGASAITARLMVVRLLEAMRKIPINCEGHPPFHITFSAGVAVCKGSMPCPADRLIAYADEALYEAKRTGKNRVVLSRQTPGAPYDKNTMVQSQEKQLLFSGKE
ncbi:GGDEF domain-containing protein [Oleidesulfovibrio sp.]|uniref:GGDEF domain-containing protein n=1 Tax=Oleidesulfovibrio sp. TaxID=2909707 RepID=UPI003A86273D